MALGCGKKTTTTGDVMRKTPLRKNDALMGFTVSKRVHLKNENCDLTNQKVELANKDAGLTNKQGGF